MNPFAEIFGKQLAYFNTDVTKSYEWRIDQLDRMARMLSENEKSFQEAIGKDFKTSFAEQLFETSGTLGSIQNTKAQLRSWMEPVEITPIPKFLAENGYKGMVYREPFGVILVIGPSNGPLLLSLRPVINAIAAGNPVILKTSESLPYSGRLLLDLIPKYFEDSSFTVIPGGRQEITDLLQLPFSYIFFTGSSKVGKVVMKAAAENLTPVLLELGGQNPVIVDETADVKDAAKKVAWGATAWGGQWCTSPGYVCVHESIAEEFIAEAKQALIDMYGTEPRNSPDLSRIVTTNAVSRLAELVDPDKVVAGGDYDVESRYFAPTIVYPVSWDDKIMEDEVFGPVLPVIVYSDIIEVVKKIKSMPKPLSAYIFSTNEKQIASLLNSISFGGGCVNEVNIYLYIETLPFGGVGASGIGSYYGKWGFDTLTHPKSVLMSPADKEISHLIPPYDQQKIEGLGNWLYY
ncbi:aldehyde dehydrogenase family protein [Mucilaginibacter sp. cycad4]|uniref:aldehyde dehydrogenase family protein n=1 Tax=Mucilaginibacter sp. cycad4 TaxID=3342096 RepID=UPI002AAADD23|nr:aldehyde dehydrogenase family protein [Mucilaginibacter gossypii]WPU99137.1 aldehyde dehydrogenase family protein [Mucilaginibacter gossypii]